ncbi:hypothetical protein ACWDSJ_09295 [Nocardia sp. NPDC003482]
MQRSADRYQGWGDVVIFAACTAARIGEVSGCRVRDIDPESWTWRVRRQTTPSPGGLDDKGTEGNRARTVPLIEEVRQPVAARLAVAGHDPDARCSAALAVAGSPRACCGTRRIGMRWSACWGMSICGTRA